MPDDLRSLAVWLSSADVAVQGAFLDTLTEDDLRALPYIFEMWAHDHQLPPAYTPKGADWRTWVIMGGRGAGKTRAGAEWVRSQVEGSLPLHSGKAKRLALIGETYDQVRDVMVFGDSGILACSPPDRKPEWLASKRKLVWPNGAEAQCFSASEPESLRGPQFDGAWVDELAKWKKARESWDMLQFALRLGECPQQVVTTTPRNVGVLKDILDVDSTVTTHAPTEANAGFLAQGFLSEVRRRYAGTRLGRQELDGVLLDDAEDALWSLAMLEVTRVDLGDVHRFDRVVVAVDPPVTGHAGSDECGIVVVGANLQGPPQDWTAYVLADKTVTAASPLAWATRAVDAMRQFGADKIVAEVNQGGDMVEQMIRQIDPLAPYAGVRASRGKAARAEPVAMLYEQGRVRHVRHLEVLEEQMCQMTTRGFEGKGSPDRVDALVWALNEVMIEPAAKYRHPRLRTL
ncbi:DNA-packaging protein [Nereida sp. NH-UV-3]|uniref:DNA-packaging protein n=1 Tax=Nereida TaxID=282198 RepID=UPI0036F32D36